MFATAMILMPRPATAAHTAQPSGPSQAEMTAVADRFDRAQIEKDGRTLETMVDPALIFIDGSGKRSDKAVFVAGWTAPGDRFDPVTLHDRSFTPLGPDAFVVTAQTILTGISDGTRFSSKIRFSDTFRRGPKGWRAIHIQVTRIGNAAQTGQ